MTDFDPLTLEELNAQLDVGSGSDGKKPKPRDSRPFARSSLNAPPLQRPWPPRRNLGAAELPPVMRFDLSLLPVAIRLWVSDEAARMPCSIEFVAVTALATIGSVIGASCSLHPKGRDPWAVAAIVWGMLVGPPGAMKTPAMNAGTKPLMVLIEEARLEYEAEMRLYCVEKKKHDALMQGLEEEMKKGARSSGDREAMVAVVGEKIRVLESCAPKEPVHRRYETHDATVEKVVDLLRDNHRGIMDRRDELARLLHGFERPEHAGDRGTYLEGHEGLHSKAIDRIKRGEIHVPNNCITLLGGIQPEVLGSWLHLTTAIKQNDGFQQRFQLMVYPNPPDWSWINEAPVFGASDRALAVFRTLRDFDPKKRGAVQGDHDKFPWFQFSLEAQEVFIEWLTELRNVRIPRESDPLIQQHLTKYDRLFCSLSLIFHLVDRADHEANGDHDGDSGFVGNYVSAVCAKRAAAWCEFLESHARRCYALLAHHMVGSAAMLAQKIRHGDLKEGFTKRDVFRHQWAGLQSDEAIRDALDWLEGVGWIRCAPRQSGQGGRPTDRYEIHPDLQAEINTSSVEMGNA